MVATVNIQLQTVRAWHQRHAGEERSMSQGVAKLEQLQCTLRIDREWQLRNRTEKIELGRDNDRTGRSAHKYGRHGHDTAQDGDRPLHRVPLQACRVSHAHFAL